jgi:hypothetical protein
MYVITCNLYAFDDCKLHAKLVLSLAHVPFETLVESWKSFAKVSFWGVNKMHNENHIKY